MAILAFLGSAGNGGLGAAGGNDVGFAYFEVGVFFAQDVHDPPAVEVVGKGAGTHQAEAVLFGEVYP